MRLATAVHLVFAGSVVIILGVEDLIEGIDQAGRLIGAFIGVPFVVVLGFRLWRGRRARSAAPGHGPYGGPAHERTPDGTRPEVQVVHLQHSRVIGEAHLCQLPSPAAG